MAAMECPSEEWWKSSVVYEIVPHSFQDSNGDGKGDLRGLLSRLDHLCWLGVDTLWLTPVYLSPFLDLGYDVADFTAIDPSIGTLSEFDLLIEACHEHHMRIVLDLVPNHTSVNHSWFAESTSSRDNEKADWYLWADPAATGGPPNNWLSRFGGSGWEWCESRQQYYYHSFLREQPDLNWRNDAVKHAIADVMRFWLARGVDGFRVDASAVLIKDALLRDNPPAPEADESRPPPQRYDPVFTDDRPEAMHCIEFIRSVLDEFPGRLLCGEVQGKTDRIGHFYGNSAPRLHLPLNFALLDSAWDAVSLQATIDAYLNALPDGAWPCWVIGGHDKQRVASKLGGEQARILAMLLFSLPGTPFFYMGDEIGRERVPIPADRVRDPFEQLVGGYDLGRDPERAPMRWDDSPKGGFSSGEPWLPLECDGARSVLRQRDEDRSILQLYRTLIQLRRGHPGLHHGEYRPLRAEHDVLRFERCAGDRTVLIGLNLSAEPRYLSGCEGMLLLSTHLDQPSPPPKGATLLRANEGVIFELGVLDTQDLR